VAGTGGATHLGFKGLKLILLGLTVLLLSYRYDRYLQTNKCPYCKSDVPDEADICPNCYRSQFQYEGVSCGQAVGIALNIIAQGGTIFLLYILTGDKGNTSTLASGAVPSINIPVLENIPWLGEIFSRHWILTYLAFIFTWLVSVVLNRTRLGVHLRAVGENPVAAGTVGIDVRRTQTVAIGLSGFFASLGGLSLSMAYLTFFQSNMTAGRGFIALAAVLLGGRTALGTMLAALIFGFADALANQFGSLAIPPQWVQMIPYVATVIALVVYSFRRQAQQRERIRRFQAAENQAAHPAEAGTD